MLCSISVAISSTGRSPWASTSTISARRPLASAFAALAQAVEQCRLRDPVRHRGTLQLSVFKRIIDKPTGFPHYSSDYLISHRSEAGMKRLSAEQMAALDPDAFLAVLGKRVIHPGGRLHRPAAGLGGSRLGDRVLDIGCGVGTTALRIARQTGATVVAADISPLMRERAIRNVGKAGAENVTVETADILDLPYADGSFDCVLAEAVTMFVDRPRAAAELTRVCKPGGRVLATEFCWREPPTPQAREIFLGQVCPGLQFDSVQEWVRIYTGAGLTDVRTEHRAVRDDDRPRHARRRTMARVRRRGEAMSRPAYLRKMAWLMPRMSCAVPYLGYIVVEAIKPRITVDAR
jgi:SAM-dependent methyltransferase